MFSNFLSLEIHCLFKKLEFLIINALSWALVSIGFYVNRNLYETFVEIFGICILHPTFVKIYFSIISQFWFLGNPNICPYNDMFKILQSSPCCNYVFGFISSYQVHWLLFSYMLELSKYYNLFYYIRFVNLSILGTWNSEIVVICVPQDFDLSGYL